LLDRPQAAAMRAFLELDGVMQDRMRNILHDGKLNGSWHAKSNYNRRVEKAADECGEDWEGSTELRTLGNFRERGGEVRVFDAHNLEHLKALDPPEAKHLGHRRSGYTPDEWGL